MSRKIIPPRKRRSENYWAICIRRFLKTQKAYIRAREVVEEWIILHPKFHENTTVLNKTRKLSALISTVCPIHSETTDRRKRLYRNIFVKDAKEIWPDLKMVGIKKRRELRACGKSMLMTEMGREKNASR